MNYHQTTWGFGYGYADIKRDPIKIAWSLLKEEVRLRGSTGASLRTLPDGRRVVVKRGGFGGGDPEGHIRTEYDRNRYLNALGVGVPEAEMLDEGSRPTMLTQFEEGAVPIGPLDTAKLRQDVVPHALIANWDVVGMEDDNVLRRPDGSLSYVDVGGAGPYRAQGARKGPDFGPTVNEFETFPQHMPQYFAGLTDKEIGRSYDRYGGQDAMEAALNHLRSRDTADTLRQRISDVARRVA